MSGIEIGIDPVALQFGHTPTPTRTAIAKKSPYQRSAAPAITLSGAGE